MAEAGMGGFAACTPPVWMVHLPTCCCVPEAPAYLKAGYSGIICRAFPSCSDHATREGWVSLPLAFHFFNFLFFYFSLHQSCSLVTCSGVWEEEKSPGWVCNFINHVSVCGLFACHHAQGVGLKGTMSLFTPGNFVKAGTWKPGQCWEPLPGAGKEKKN